ncbi:hypothetical protein G4O51_02340 [Candidatus Bathyarchaeota archaeon A05DMB-2]|nr:hypothetical protein [Candidatus Bathyarchaeota archaeon A05DMB-2]
MEKVEAQKKSDPANAKAPKEHSKMHHIKPKIQKTDGKQRDGKGFSLNELKEAGLNKADAKRLKIPVDPRRKTAHAENIETLKAHLAQQKLQTKPKSKPERQAAKNKPKK